MIVEYVSCKVSKIRWKTPSISLMDRGKDLTYVTGTWDNQPKNKVSLCSLQAGPDKLEMIEKAHLDINGNVSQICIFNDNNCLVTTSNGSAYLYDIDGLHIKHLTHLNLHNGSCNDAIFNKTSNKLITCGEDGVIAYLSLKNGQLNPMKSKSMIQGSFICLDHLSPNEIILGTETGHLKVYDIRSEKLVMSLFLNNPSIVSCVKRNPSLSHIVACGSDSGVLSLFDLRDSSQQLLQAAAHSTYINELQYKENEPNKIITASFDGQLLVWTIKPTGVLDSVDCFLGEDGAAPVNSFHVNSGDEIIVAVDNEALYYGNL